MSLERRSGTDLDGAAQLAADARLRLASIAADLARPTKFRLSDWQRTAISALLAGLLGAIEDELRSALLLRLGDDLPDAPRAALSSAHLPLAQPLLEGRAILSDPALLSALLRRTEEHRLRRAHGADQPLLLDLAGDADAEIAAAAMAVLVAQAARRDPFDEPLLPRQDLPAELAHGLIWAAAAALRTYLTGRHGIDPPLADAALTAAAGDLLARYDEGEGYEAKCQRLVAGLRAAGRLDRAFIVGAAAEGQMVLFLAALADETGLDVEAVWEIVSAGSGQGLPLLLRSAGFSREETAAVLVALQHPEQHLAKALDRVESTSREQAQAALTLWRADPAYRAAVAELIP